MKREKIMDKNQSVLIKLVFSLLFLLFTIPLLIQGCGENDDDDGNESDTPELLTIAGTTLNPFSEMFALKDDEGGAYTLAGFSTIDDYSFKTADDKLSCTGTPPEIGTSEESTDSDTSKCKKNFSMFVMGFCNDTVNGISECKKPEVGKKYDFTSDDRPLLSAMVVNCKKDEEPEMWMINSYPKDLYPFTEMEAAMENAALIKKVANLVKIDENNENAMAEFQEAMEEMIKAMIATSKDLAGNITFTNIASKVGEQVKVSMDNITLRKFMPMSKKTGVAESIKLSMNFDGKLLEEDGSCDLPGDEDESGSSESSESSESGESSGSNSGADGDTTDTTDATDTTETTNNLNGDSGGS